VRSSLCGDEVDRNAVGFQMHPLFGVDEPKIHLTPDEHGCRNSELLRGKVHPASFQ